MIIVDASELHSNSKLPELPDSTTSNVLEEITGADLMVTLLKAPATNKMLIEKHIQSGALLVQRKHGLDLSSSIGERLNKSLAKMQSVGARQCQCVLLFIGYLTSDDNGRGLINRQDTRHDFFTVQASLSKWHDRGGVVEHLPKASLLQGWLDMKLRHLLEYEQKGEKEFIKPAPVVHAKDEFLQVLVPVNDGRVMLSVLPGIGPKTANILWEYFKGDTAEALCCLTHPQTAHDIKGIGPKTIENVREYLGLDETMHMTMDLFSDEYIDKIVNDRIAKKNRT